MSTRNARLSAVNRLAHRISRRFHHRITWGTAFRAAQRLLSRCGWLSLRGPLAAHLDALSAAYGAQDDGRSHAFARAADVARSTPSFAAFTRASGIGTELRAEAAMFAVLGDRTPRARSVIFPA